MLVPPTKGFAVSVNVHNVELDALTEWIEGCVTFADDRISRSEIADILIEEQYYRSQDFASARIGDAWKELTWRKKCLGEACSFTVAKSHVERIQSWKKTPAYAFCLMLSLQVSYRPAFTAIFGKDFTEQGVLFERLTIEALEHLGWKTHGTGWSRTAAASIGEKVDALAAHINEIRNDGAIERWTDQHAKDGGLDVVCHFPFADRWSGRPIYYIQCASGEDWKAKRATPILAVWDKLLDLATRPTRGISIPFALLADEFRRAANYDLLSLILDRNRLCMPVDGVKSAWISNDLAKDLNRWTGGRLPALMKAKAA